MKLIVKALENDVRITPRTMRTHYMCYKRRCRRPRNIEALWRLWIDKTERSPPV